MLYRILCVGKVKDAFFRDEIEELTKQIALEVEKYDVKKQLDGIIDSFCEEKAKKSLEEQWINMNL